MNTINKNPNRFLLHWFFNALVAWPLAGVACLRVWIPVALLLSLLARFDTPLILEQILTVIMLLILPGLSIGYMIGNLQNRLLHDYLDWELTGWVKLSSAGGIIGSTLLILSHMLFARYLPESVQWMMALPLFILPVSVMQWWLLRPTTRNAWLWILANLAGGIVFSSLIFNNSAFLSSKATLADDFLTWLIAAASLGLITGIVILWLYERPVSDFDDENPELAPVYIEVRNQDKL